MEKQVIKPFLNGAEFVRRGRVLTLSEARAKELQALGLVGDVETNADTKAAPDSGSKKAPTPSNKKAPPPQNKGASDAGANA